MAAHTKKKFCGKACICIPFPVNYQHETNIDGILKKVPLSVYYKREAARITGTEYAERDGWCAVVRA